MLSGTIIIGFLVMALLSAATGISANDAVLGEWLMIALIPLGCVNPGRMPVFAVIQIPCIALSILLPHLVPNEYRSKYIL